MKVLQQDQVDGYRREGYVHVLGAMSEGTLYAIKPILMGQDAFAVERRLEVGLESYRGAEHAVWDLICKALKAPVYKLLGDTGTKSRHTSPAFGGITTWANPMFPTINELPTASN